MKDSTHTHYLHVRAQGVPVRGILDSITRISSLFFCVHEGAILRLQRSESRFHLLGSEHDIAPHAESAGQPSPPRCLLFVTLAAIELRLRHFAIAYLEQRLDDFIGPCCALGRQRCRLLAGAYPNLFWTSFALGSRHLRFFARTFVSLNRNNPRRTAPASESLISRNADADGRPVRPRSSRHRLLRRPKSRRTFYRWPALRPVPKTMPTAKKKITEYAILIYVYIILVKFHPTAGFLILIFQHVNFIFDSVEYFRPDIVVMQIAF